MNHFSISIHVKLFFALLLAPLAAKSGETAKPVAAMKAPDKLVVLTFDDGVVSHATIVAPLLKKYGFGGTFFITEAFDFATNKVDYMTWEQIKGLHDAGFEIGNHTRQHAPVTSQMPADLLADVEFIEKQCAAHQIPRPTSFCYPVYAANAAAVEFLRGRGYRFARGGGGRGFDPAKDEPLLMPQAFDSKPGATFEQFVAAVGTARDGKIAVLTFHGVPDKQHPWVSTEPAVFEKYLNYLKSQGCTVIAARDMAKYLPGVAGAADANPAAGNATVGEPFWSSKVMKNEPVLFIQEEGKSAASGKLLFIPRTKPIINHPDLVTTYEEGKDYIWRSGSNTIELTPNSRIPFKSSAQMKPAQGGLGGRLFSEGHYFHDLQVQVTYPHDDAWSWQPAPCAQPLTRSLARLKQKLEFEIVALGDSITEGYNASGFAKVMAAPFQPSYPQLVANTLQLRFGSQVTLANLGVAGAGAGLGLTQIDQIKAANPDLVTIAFGMNHTDPGPAFEATMRKLLAAVQAAVPQADVILVSPMTQAPDQGKVADKFLAYRQALNNLVTTNVAMADVTTPFAELLKRKEFSDLSGNNYNHPNDFTHRLYAQVICQHFTSDHTVTK